MLAFLEDLRIAMRLFDKKNRYIKMKFHSPVISG